jgi:hypothetical protein
LKPGAVSEIVATQGLRGEEHPVRLSGRTATAFAFACLLAGSALSQGSPDQNPSPHAVTTQTDPGDDAVTVSNWNLDDVGLDDTFDTVGEEDWRPATDLDALDKAHEAYLKNTDLQLERPEWEAEALPPPPPPPPWLKWLADLLSALAPIFVYLFYAIVIAVIGGILYFIFGEALRVRFGKSGAGKVDAEDDDLIDVRPDAAMARSLLEEADALARAGKFAEAVHLLLFRSIEDIQTRLEGGVPKSLTAREIGGLQDLPERAKRGLGPIIRIVERSFFGGREVDADGWQEARASYQDFAFGEAWA